MKKSASTPKRTADNATTPKRRKARTQQVGELVNEAVEQATDKAAHRQQARKIVDIEIDASDMEAATEKAQLFVAHDEAGQRFKFWLPKSQICLLPDGDNPGRMICRLAAWLYYRSGLSAVYPVARWSTMAE